MESSTTAAVLFCDIVGSTARQARLGDRGADELRHRLFPLLERCVVAGGGHLVKTLGDGLMAVFERSTIGALECAVRMHATAAEFDPIDPLELRIGVSIGEVLEEDGDWFGTPVVEAARLCAAADAKGTLAHAMVASLVGSRGDHYTFGDTGVRSLKGMSDPVPVVSLLGGTDAAGHPLGASSASEMASGGAPVASDDPVNPPERSMVARVRPYIAALAVALIVVGGAAVWRSTGAASGAGSTDEEQVVGQEDPGSEPNGYTPVVEKADCAQEVILDIPEARCGFLVVPENREDPASKLIRVQYTMAPARSDTGADPVVMMGFNEQLNRTSLRDVADVYALGVRGFDPGTRVNLQCDELRSAWEQRFSLDPDNPSGIQSVAAAAGACATRLRSEGADLNGYNWKQVALDIRDLAIAESLDRVNIATESYLALAAVQVVRLNPGLTSSLLLTNPVAPGASGSAEAPRSVALELDHMDELCTNDPACSVAHGDLRRVFEQRAAALDSDPVVVSTESLDGDGPFTILLEGQRLGAALAASMRASAQLGLVPASIQGASPELIAAVSINDPMKAFFADHSSAGADLSMRCSYDAQPTRVSEALMASGSYVAGAGDRALAPMCEAWNVKSRFNDLSGPLQEDLPVLVAEGGLAASGVNEWGTQLTELVDSPVMLRFDTLSEDLIYDPPACLAEIRNAFVVDPTSVTGVAECERESPPIKWVAGT